MNDLTIFHKLQKLIEISEILSVTIPDEYINNVSINESINNAYSELQSVVVFIKDSLDIDINTILEESDIENDDLENEDNFAE